MSLADKLGELGNHEKAYGYNIIKVEKKFVIEVWIKDPQIVGLPHTVKTNEHTNLHKAVDEAIELFREHLSECSLC